MALVIDDRARSSHARRQAGEPRPKGRLLPGRWPIELRADVGDALTTRSGRRLQSRGVVSTQHEGGVDNTSTAWPRGADTTAPRVERVSATNKGRRSWSIAGKLTRPQVTRRLPGGKKRGDEVVARERGEADAALGSNAVASSRTERGR